MLGFIIRGFIWDIPILFFSYVLFWDPTKEPLQRTRQMPSWKTPQLQREVGLERYWFSSCSLRRRSYVGFLGLIGFIVARLESSSKIAKRV